MFLGTYSRRIDKTGRIILPFNARKELGEGFIIAPGFEAYLFVYPTEVFGKLIAKLNQLSLKDWQNRHLFQSVVAGAKWVIIGSQGRAMVPSELRRYAFLDKGERAVVLGAVEYLEIWNKRIWEEIGERQLKTLANGLLNFGENKPGNNMS